MEGAPKRKKSGLNNAENSIRIMEINPNTFPQGILGKCGDKKNRHHHVGYTLIKP